MDVINSAMATSEIEKLVARKNEIASTMAEKRSAFESADVETRDGILDEVTNLEKEANEIDTEIKSLEEQRAKFEEQEKRMDLVKNVESTVVEERKTVTMVDPYDTPEYRHAYREFVMTGDDKAMREAVKRAGLKTTDDNMPIPTYLQNRIEANWERLSILNEVTISNYKGILAIPFEVSADPAVFHVEGTAAPAEEELTLGRILIEPIMLKKWISYTDEVRAMTDDEFLRYVADEVVYQVNLKLENSIVVDANSKSKLIGMTASDQVVPVTANTLTFNSFNEALAELVVDDATIIMNRKTFYKNVMALTDLQGRPIYQVATDNMGKPRFFVNGLRVKFSNALPAFDAATAGQAWAIVGDLSAYRLNMPEGRGVKVLVDPYTLAREDKEYILGRVFVGGDVVKQKRIARLVKAS